MGAFGTVHALFAAPLVNLSRAAEQTKRVIRNNVRCVSVKVRST